MFCVSKGENIINQAQLELLNVLDLLFSNFHKYRHISSTTQPLIISHSNLWKSQPKVNLIGNLEKRKKLPFIGCVQIIHKVHRIHNWQRFLRSIYQNETVTPSLNKNQSTTTNTSINDNQHEHPSSSGLINKMVMSGRG
jgi:hypothetical protein